MGGLAAQGLVAIESGADGSAVSGSSADRSAVGLLTLSMATPPGCDKPNCAITSPRPVRLASTSGPISKSVAEPEVVPRGARPTATARTRAAGRTRSGVASNGSGTRTKRRALIGNSGWMNCRRLPRPHVSVRAGQRHSSFGTTCARSGYGGYTPTRMSSARSISRSYEFNFRNSTVVLPIADLPTIRAPTRSK